MERRNQQEASLNVEEGVKEFRELQRTISSFSEIKLSERKHKSTDPNSTHFDLQAFFENSVRSEEGKSQLKKLGVIFKNLTIVGQGADATSITDNLTIWRFLWPGTWYINFYHH